MSGSATHAVYDQMKISRLETEIKQLCAEVERLKVENADLRRWKAMDKPLTAAMGVVNNDMQRLRSEVERLTRENDALYDMLKGMKINIARILDGRALEGRRDSMPAAGTPPPPPKPGS